MGAWVKLIQNGVQGLFFSSLRWKAVWAFLEQRDRNLLQHGYKLGDASAESEVFPEQ